MRLTGTLGGMLALGLLCGIAASVLFNLGIALQALEARSAPRGEGLRLSLLRRLLRRPRWIAGLLLGALGVPLEILAFANAPFVVVEPILACGLLVLLVVGTRILGESPGVDVVLGVVAIIAGTALIAWGAPAHSEQHRGPVAVVVVMALLVALSLVPFALRGTPLDGALVPNLGSACGFAATNVAAKLMADDLGANQYEKAAAWLLVAGFAGVAATVTGMTALQRRPATTVVPISTAVQTFLPIALEPLFLTESWRAAELGGGGLLAGVVVLLVGTVLVARAHSVSRLAAGSSG
ncbi:MAG TPA: DMT family transporter [Solirubrobacterales bacterium]|nr:DMT family transporter [Solirubrobacterales bacterium]